MKRSTSSWKRYGAAGLVTLVAIVLPFSACSSTNGTTGSGAPVEAGTTDGTEGDGGIDGRDAAGPGSEGGGASLCAASSSSASWPDASAPFAPQVLGTGTYSGWGQTWTYQLLRLPNANGGFTYAEWLPRSGGGTGPVMVGTVPYDGIDWSGDAIDAQWASRPNAASGYSYPDVNGPGGSMASPSITYKLVSPSDELSALGFPHFLNGMSVLLIYGRFYAGGNLDSYVGDMQAGMRFLAQAPGVDATRVGVFGASWGGFEAAYTAAYAEPGVVPAVGVPIAPPLDFSVLATHATTGLDASVPAAALASFQTFYDPYLRRMFAATGGPPSQAGSDYSHYTGAALCPRLQTALLVPQDDWDTLIPVDEARAFVQGCACQATGLWYQHLDAPPAITPSHGPMVQGVPYTNDAGAQASGYPSVFTFSFAFMYARLLPASATVLLPYGQPDMLQFLQSVRAWQQGGRDVGYVAARLIEFAQANVQAYDLTGILPSPTSGATVLAGMMAQVWPNAGLDPTNVLARLQASGLPSP